MKQKIIQYVLGFLIFLVKKVLPFAIGIIALVGLSFLFTKDYSSTALSERLFWSGIAVMLVAGILVTGQTSGGRNFGIQGQFISTAHAATLTDFNIEIRQAVEKQFDFRMQIFLIGTFVLLSGVLSQVLIK